MGLLSGPSGVGKSALVQAFLKELEGPGWDVIDVHLTHLPSAGLLKLLVSSAVESPPLKLLLVGQEPLRQTLRQSQHAALLSRMRVRHQLRSLRSEETVSYIDFQLKYAGASCRLFDADAKRMIHEYAGGMIRMINNLATASRIQAMAKDVERVGESIVSETVREFQLG